MVWEGVGCLRVGDFVCHLEWGALTRVGHVGLCI